MKSYFIIILIAILGINGAVFLKNKITLKPSQTQTQNSTQGPSPTLKISEERDGVPLPQEEDIIRNFLVFLAQMTLIMPL